MRGARWAPVLAACVFAVFAFGTCHLLGTDESEKDADDGSVPGGGYVTYDGSSYLLGRLYLTDAGPLPASGYAVELHLCCSSLTPSGGTISGVGERVFLALVTSTAGVVDIGAYHGETSPAPGAITASGLALGYDFDAGSGTPAGTVLEGTEDASVEVGRDAGVYTIDFEIRMTTGLWATGTYTGPVDDRL